MPAPRPTPSLMAGRQDPALQVRPVDYSTWKPPAPTAVDGDAATSVTDTAPSADRATPVAEGISPARSARRAAHRDDRGTPKPGPGPRPVRQADFPNSSTQATGQTDSAQQVVGQAHLRVDPVLARMLEDLRRGLRPDTAAPQEALYTADSHDSTQPDLDVPHAGVEVHGLWDVTESDLERAVTDPEDTWTADLGRTDYYVRGHLCVHVVRAEHRVIGVYRSGWALARRPDETWADQLDHLDQQGPKPGGGGTRYPTNRRELLARLRAAGFHVTTSGPTHGKITHPQVPGRFLPFSSTPSSQRYGRHVVTAVNRVFGIDLRIPPKI